MATTRFTLRVLAGSILTAAVGGAAVAQKADDVLARKPVQPGVSVTTPADAGQCQVQPVEWPGNGAAKPKGIVLTDAGGKKLRQFVDTTGGNTFNILSFYTDGVESYREIDANANGKPEQFRWLGANGGKWGVDKNEDGTIDQWLVLSAEEAAQELFAAVKANSPERLKPLLVTDEDVKALKLTDADAEKVRAKAAGAAAKFAATVAGLKLTDKSKWQHAELNPPHTTPKDTAGTPDDVVRHRNVGVLVDVGGEAKMAYFSTGEMILVGKVWKLIDGPSVGAPSADAGDTPDNVAAIPESIRGLVEKMTQIAPPKDATDVHRYHVQRAQLLEEINDGKKVQGVEQQSWLKQMIDAYTAAVEAKPGEKAVFDRFTAWKDAIVGQKVSVEMAAYVSFRHGQAEHAVRMSAAGVNNAEVAKVQEWRRINLEQFVTDYAKSADAPEAVLQLAIAAEYLPKDAEATAKKWYERLLKDYAQHPNALKAAGSIKRLASEGQAFAIAGDTFDGQKFTEKALAGKPAVIYYWASWSGPAVEQFKELAKLEKDYGAKGLTVVTVCLDDVGTKAEALATLKASGLNGVHLYTAGGLDNSPLATAYGIHMVPHVFLVGKDTKVANRNALYSAGLKDEIEKLLK